MKYGIDIKTPTTIPGQDGWVPIMKNSVARWLWPTAIECVAFERTLRSQGHQTRLVEVHGQDDPTYSV